MAAHRLRQEDKGSFTDPKPPGLLREVGEGDDGRKMDGVGANEWGVAWTQGSALRTIDSQHGILVCKALPLFL